MDVSVSVIIPTFNRAYLLSEAIDSCLSQEHEGHEVVVVDDASTDRTDRVVNRYRGRVRHIRLDTNVGSNEARNAGMAIARGLYLKFLDSDDVLADGSLADELQIAEATLADMVISSWGIVDLDTIGKEHDDTKKTFPAPSMEPIADAVLAGRAVPTSAVLYRAKYLSGMRWDTNICKLQDWDWFCRAALRNGRIVSRKDGISYWIRHHSGPRISSAATLHQNAVCHHLCLNKIERILRDREELTGERSRRLAQYYYKELRVLKRFDEKRFAWALAHIFELDPNFVPIDEEPNAALRFLARTCGVERALNFYGRMRSVKDRFSSLND
jgi:glycosyltransferase involved in cell wall biosynthesis